MLYNSFVLAMHYVNAMYMYFDICFCAYILFLRATGEYTSNTIVDIDILNQETYNNKIRHDFDHVV